MRRIAILTALILVVSVSAVAQTNGTADNETTGNFTDTNTTLQEDANQSNVSTAILTSSLNYPDTVISSTPSELIGAPILLTDNNNLSQSTEEALQSMNVEKVYIVGGPAVISSEVKSEVESITENSTTRLWGETQVGTSTEVSEFFWMESNEATVVQQPVNSQRGYELLTPLTSSLTESREPLLISETGNLSNETVDELERLDVNQVEVYSTNATNVTQQLNEIGVSSPEINEGSIEELREGIRNETVTEDTENITVVAAPNFTYSLASANLREPSVLVTQSNETSTVIETINRTQDENIRIIGEQQLAQNVSQEIENSTNLSTTLVTGEPVETVAQMVTQNSQTWSELIDQRLQSWMSELQNSQQIETAAENSIEEAETVLEQVESEEAQSLLDQARDELQQENYLTARNLAITASSEARVQAYLNNQLDQIGNQTENQTEQSPTDNQTPTDNESQNTSQNQNLEAGDSQINLTVNNTAISTSISYVAPNTGYSVEPQVNSNGETVTFLYNITSSEEASGQALTELRASESQTGLSPGNYTVNTTIIVDGETVDQVNEEVELVG